MSILKPIVNPPDLEECQTYAEFKRDISAWSGMTHVEKKIQGGVIAYNLSNNSKYGHDLKDYVYAEHTPESLNDDEEGVKKVIKVLDSLWYGQTSQWYKRERPHPGVAKWPGGRRGQFRRCISSRENRRESFFGNGGGIY